MDQNDLHKKIQNIEKISRAHFKKEEIREAILTYKELQFLCPKDEKYYSTYLRFFKEEEIVIAEFLQESFTEILETCERAIKNLTADEVPFFYKRKLETYIELIDGSFGSWYTKNKDLTDQFIGEMLQKYPENISVLKRLHRLYDVLGRDDEAATLLDKMYKMTNGNDFRVMILKIGALKNTQNTEEAIEILETYVEKYKDGANNLKNIYTQLIALYKKINNHAKANYYDTLLDNID
ncbi:hypothetical protein BC749_102910 [Flavobacterium araucananum]|uniref:Tetratricopeptide repeat protein n=1 Tax=Flavobacterium araucananum TaxID=946678 RepID=A0A227PB40_9FLAO|nr:hypothetical protein [Flavobacterium araucananum]OXG07127.1 hypothetical protein B0A64_09965 [Flavobacterium araucananum]PWK01334.1 hypothetical protein BC749_102910 [Flavobacterium araucananum]